MAEELNFSIEDTMEMGSGDSQLLNDLISPETSTAKPGDITEIVKTVEDEDPKKKEAKPPKGKDIVQKLPGEEKTQQDILTNFLGDNSEEDDDGDGEEGDADDKGDIKNPKTEKPEDTNEGDSTFKLLAKELKTLGVFTDPDEGEEEVEPETPQEFLERRLSECF